MQTLVEWFSLVSTSISNGADAMVQCYLLLLSVTTIRGVIGLGSEVRPTSENTGACLAAAIYTVIKYSKWDTIPAVVG